MDCDLQAPPSRASLAPVKPPEIPPWLENTESDDEDAIIQFTTIRELFQSINQAIGDVLTVQGVSAHNFTKIEAKRDRSGRKFRFYYFADESLLIVTIPSSLPRVVLAGEIYNEVIEEIRQMGLWEPWQSTGRTTFTSNSGTLEADASGKPIDQRYGGGQWPTLVIEVGYSQSLRGLRRIMRHWFYASSQQVKIVILAKIQPHQGMIVIEKWQEGPSSNRPGATNTRASGVVKPYCDGPILITKTGTVVRNSQSYSITRNVPLRLEFELLFLRAPGPGEHDVVLTTQHLQRCAARAMM